MFDNKRIALIRLSAIGDVLHCTPVARAIKKAAPSCHLTWVVGEVSQGVLTGNPYIDETYVWSREYWEKAMRQFHWGAALRYWQKLRQELPERRFDIVLDVHGLFLSGMVAAASGAPRRIGLGGARELNPWFMTETAPPVSAGSHVIWRYLSILEPLGIPADGYDMDLAVQPEAAAFAADFLAEHGCRPGEPLIAVSPRTTWDSKNWPADHFVQAVKALNQDGRILLCGGPGDRQLGQEIVDRSGASVINAIGKTKLTQLTALLARSHALLTGDTGPLHMAVALKVPTVSIFGPTSPEKFGPLPPGHIVLHTPESCPPCSKMKCPRGDLRCMNSITPEAVVAAVRRQLR
ncbi:MAG: glycosyltransferase family 9 protein [Negativicutes bacterium]|nr:glycosyltransferase family 9 protein [Negativicutes bacterium]